MTEEKLWELVIRHQGETFYTLRGLPFTYEVKRGRKGDYNRELLISRRTESKSLTWSSVQRAFARAKEMEGIAVTRPKQLGDIRGISYIYAMFLDWGIIRAE